jgi:hypothetical protein
MKENEDYWVDKIDNFAIYEAFKDYHSNPDVSSYQKEMLEFQNQYLKSKNITSKSYLELDELKDYNKKLYEKSVEFTVQKMLGIENPKDFIEKNGGYKNFKHITKQILAIDEYSKEKEMNNLEDITYGYIQKGGKRLEQQKQSTLFTIIAHKSKKENFIKDTKHYFKNQFNIDLGEEYLVDPNKIAGLFYTIHNDLKAFKKEYSKLIEANKGFKEVIRMYQRKANEIIRNNETLDELVENDPRGQIRKTIENDPVIIKILEENPELAEDLVQHIQTNQISLFKDQVLIEKLKKAKKIDQQIAKEEIEDKIIKHSKNDIAKIWIEGNKFQKLKKENPRKAMEMLKQYEVIFNKIQKLVDKDENLNNLLELESIKELIKTKPQKVLEKLQTRYMINREQGVTKLSEKKVLEEIENDSEIVKQNSKIKKALENNDKKLAAEIYRKLNKIKEQTSARYSSQGKLTTELKKKIQNTHTQEGVENLILEDTIKNTPEILQKNPEIKTAIKNNNINEAIKLYKPINQLKEEILYSIMTNQKIPIEEKKRVQTELNNLHTTNDIQNFQKESILNSLKTQNPELFEYNKDLEKQIKETPIEEIQQKIQLESEKKQIIEQLKQTNKELFDNNKDLENELKTTEGIKFKNKLEEEQKKQYNNKLNSLNKEDKEEFEKLEEMIKELTEKSNNDINNYRQKQRKILK